MASVVIRNLPDEIHRALKHRAAEKGRSTEAEIRDILATAVLPAEAPKIGSALRAFGRQFGGLDLDIERDRTPAEPISFE